MLRLSAGLFVIIMPIAVAAAAEAASSAPTTQATTTTPAATSGDPKVDRILDQLERRGDEVESIATKLRADFIDVVAEDEQSKIGKLWFRRDKPNPKFKVIYEKTLFDGIEREDRHAYAFDGRYLIEQHDQAKTRIRREIVKEGETIEPFRIGKGPFPLPFGQKKAEILRHFKVSLVRRSPKDPKNTDHLKLIPKKDSSMAEKYEQLHFYIDRDLKLPVRVVAHQRRPGSNQVDEIVRVTFNDLEVNPKVTDEMLTIPKPSGKEWHYSEETLEQ